MGNISKTLAFLLTLIIAMSCLTLITVGFANAQSVTKPSIPQFTLSFVNASYSKGSDFFQNEVIDISIVNQPFTSYYVVNNSVDLYYKISWNTSSTTTGLSQFWGFNNTVWLASNCRRDPENGTLLNPNAKTTDITLNFVTNNYSVPLGLSPPLPDIPVGGQADFQVQASIGYYSGAVWYGNSWFGWSSSDLNSSDWSPIQTITIPESNASPTQSPTPTSSVPEFPATIVLTFLVLTVLAVAVVSRRKHLTRC
jgi:hypothetical protein